MSRVTPVCFVGMTHLGLVSAIAVAAKGRSVICFDQSESLITELLAGKFPVSEPGLNFAATEHSTRILFTSNPEMINQCDLVYLSVDVPTDDVGNSNLEPILVHFRLIRAYINDEAVVVVLSQVPPSFTRSLDFDHSRLFYQAETLVFGRALERAMQPERLIVGSSDSSQPLPTIFQDFLEDYGCPILHMSLESAELTKIAINLFLVSSISTANMLSDICECIGADWAEVAPALRLDERIGPRAYLKPGLGFGGGNLERDIATIRRIGEQTGTNIKLAELWISNSTFRKTLVFRKIKELFPADWRARHFCILGLTYKEDTASTKNSAALDLLRDLKGAKISVHDPIAIIDENTYQATQYSTVSHAASGADVIVIMTPWRQYQILDPENLKAVMSGNLIIDPFAVLELEHVARAKLKYFTLGRS